MGKTSRKGTNKVNDAGKEQQQQQQADVGKATGSAAAVIGPKKAAPTTSSPQELVIELSDEQCQELSELEGDALRFHAYVELPNTSDADLRNKFIDAIGDKVAFGMVQLIAQITANNVVSAEAISFRTPYVRVDRSSPSKTWVACELSCPKVCANIIRKLADGKGCISIEGFGPMALQEMAGANTVHLRLIGVPCTWNADYLEKILSYCFEVISCTQVLDTKTNQRRPDAWEVAIRSTTLNMPPTLTWNFTAGKRVTLKVHQLSYSPRLAASFDTHDQLRISMAKATYAEAITGAPKDTTVDNTSDAHPRTDTGQETAKDVRTPAPVPAAGGSKADEAQPAKATTAEPAAGAGAGPPEDPEGPAGDQLQDEQLMHAADLDKEGDELQATLEAELLTALQNDIPAAVETANNNPVSSPVAKRTRGSTAATTGNG
jgi:hypothetical protein